MNWFLYDNGLRHVRVKDRAFCCTNFHKFCETGKFSEELSSQGSFVKADTTKGSFF